MPADVLKLLTAASRPDPRPAPDADLLARFIASRDEAAFAELVRRHGPAVYRTCKHLLGSSSADDAFQATFLVLACRAKSVRKVGSVGSWLIGVAGRVSRQMRKNHRRAAGVSRLRDENTGSNGEQQGVDTPRSPELAELAAILNEELSHLPDSLRGPVVLCLVEGQTQEQAATVLGGSVRTLRRRLDRAKALLRLRLERRGVVPTVAAGLVASLASGTAALPPGLAGRTVNGVFAFFTGAGADTPAAFVAKGVVGSMARIKVSVLMAATAAVMIGLGVGWADDGPPPAPPPAAPPKAAARDRIPPAPVPPSLKPGSTDMPPVVNGQSANFSVAAPTAVMARAIANEAEYQRKALAVRWLGGKLPDWPRPCSIRVTGENRKGGATAFRFGPDGKPRAPGFVSAEMELHGPFEYVLTTSLPHEVMHTVLATHFGKPVPRWADEGIALLAEPAEEQTRYDGACRKLVQDGKAFRPRTLFRAKEYPRDMMALYAQGHSLVRFLGSRGPKLPMSRAFLEIDGTAYRPGDTRARTYALLMFIQLGQSGDWDKAAKEVYGFDSVDALEAAWLDWLKKPESKLGGQPTPPAAKPADPNRIPPTPLPAGEGKLPGDTIRVTSRTQTFPIKPGLDREKNAKEVHLYVSRDRGASWQKQAVALPGQTKFVFEAPADGLYWFTVVIVTTDGRTVPPDLGRLEPMQKILVDTGGEGKR